MQVAEARSLFAYNVWANARIFGAAADLNERVLAEPRGSSFSSIRDTLAHLATSEWVWLRRWRGVSPAAPPDWGSLPDVAGLAAKLREVETERDGFLAGLTEDDLKRPLAYRNLKGDDFREPLEDQLAHVVNHSSYHRGQVATLFRQAGATAPSTDLIVFKREQPAGA